MSPDEQCRDGTDFECDRDERYRVGSPTVFPCEQAGEAAGEHCREGGSDGGGVLDPVESGPQDGRDYGLKYFGVAQFTVDGGGHRWLRSG